MRLVFAGTPEVAVASLDALVASDHDVVAVVTRPDAPSGRGRRRTPSPVAARAEELGSEVLKPIHPRDEDFQARLRAIGPDACAVVAYGALLPQSALDIPLHGWVNLHFSLLPRWRGAAPVQRAIMAGDDEIGTTCFRIVKELDAGDVYLMESLPMPEGTAGEILALLAETGAHQLVTAMDLVQAGLAPTPQLTDGVTVAPKISVEEARIDWSRPAGEIHRLILGCSPAPGAWCELDGQRFKVYLSAPAPGAPALRPGELSTTKRQVLVGTGSVALELLEVQAPGKRRMPAADWARGGVESSVLA